MRIEIKRVYSRPEEQDGFRVLIDRLWPRGISKDKARIDLWLKDIAPSAELRKWFNHDQAKWIKFKEKYFKELNSVPELTEMIVDKLKDGDVTLIYSSKEEQFNNAVALKEYIENYISPER